MWNDRISSNFVFCKIISMCFSPSFSLPHSYSFVRLLEIAIAIGWRYKNVSFVARTDWSERKDKKNDIFTKSEGAHYSHFLGAPVCREYTTRFTIWNCRLSPLSILPLFFRLQYETQKHTRPFAIFMFVRRIFRRFHDTTWFTLTKKKNKKKKILFKNLFYLFMLIFSHILLLLLGWWWCVLNVELFTVLRCCLLFWVVVFVVVGVHFYSNKLCINSFLINSICRCILCVWQSELERNDKHQHTERQQINEHTKCKKTNKNEFCAIHFSTCFLFFSLFCFHSPTTTCVCVWCQCVLYRMHEGNNNSSNKKKSRVCHPALLWYPFRARVSMYRNDVVQCRNS